MKIIIYFKKKLKYNLEKNYSICSYYSGLITKSININCFNKVNNLENNINYITITKNPSKPLMKI